jgi:hypothetical protein
MENAPAPERSVAGRSDNVRDSVRNDIGLDGQWKYQRLRESTPGYKSVGTGRFLTQCLATSTSSSLTIG